MRFLFIAAMLSLPSIAYAQDFDVSAKSVGDITSWTADDGNTSVEFKGKAGGRYRLSFRRDGSKGQPLRADFLATRRGEAVSATIGGTEFTFTPHDCSLTVGRCTYIERRPEQGQQRTVIWNASVDNGVWSYTMHHTKEVDWNLMEQGTFTVDAYGYYIDRTYTTYNNGKPTDKWTKRVR